MSYGVEGDRLYVNSAHNISIDAVNALFPEAPDYRGSIPREMVPWDIVGRVAMRREVEEIGGYSRRGAHTFLAEFRPQLWAGLPCADRKALQNRIAAYQKKTRAAHLAALGIDQSSGSNLAAGAAYQTTVNSASNVATDCYQSVPNCDKLNHRRRT